MLISAHSVSTGSASACTSKADEVARDILAPNHHYPTRLSNDEVQVTTASLLMLIVNGNVSLVDATKHVLSGLTR